MISAQPAERSPEMMWMKNTLSPKPVRTAENGPISLSFHTLRSTGRKAEDCYTFERFAPADAVLRSNYYYHYKQNRFVLKEETRWS